MIVHLLGLVLRSVVGWVLAWCGDLNMNPTHARARRTREAETGGLQREFWVSDSCDKMPGVVLHTCNPQHGGPRGQAAQELKVILDDHKVSLRLAWSTGDPVSQTKEPRSR